MAAYLRFYEFDASPFENTEKRAMVLGTRSLRGAFDQVKHGLEEDSPRICLNGSAGVGKTSFCRALPRLLGDDAKVALVLNPQRSWREIRDTIAKKFELVGGAISRRALLVAAGDSKQLVLVIDDAEQLSHESLDHLDILLQYKRDDGKQLLHCVMLANLDSASTGVEIPLLWWLDKLTTLQLQFSPIPVEGLRHYVEKHLAKAGWAGGELFTQGAFEAIHRNTGGLPRAINHLCERILIEGGAREITTIDGHFIETLCGEPEAARVESPLLSNPNMSLSADFSIGDFGASPSAQELLDATQPEPEPVSYEEERIAPDSEFLANRPPELQSLILTRDSEEDLHVEAEPERKVSEAPQHSLTIELEDDPATPPAKEETRAPIASPHVMRGRPIVESRPPTVYTGKIAAAALILAAAWWMNSSGSSTDDLIDRAEGKISKVLVREPAPGVEKEATSDEDVEPFELVEMEPPPRESLIDRADEIAADTGLDSIPLPEVEDVDVETASEHAVAEAKSEAEPSLAAVIPALKPAPKPAVDKVEASSPKPEAVTETPSPASNTDEPKPSAVAAIKSKSTAKVVDELVVINEYTAIPEAAASAPKLPIPGTAKTELDPPAEKVSPVAPPREPAREAETRMVPAKIDPAASAASKPKDVVTAKPAVVEPSSAASPEAAAEVTPEVETEEAPPARIEPSADATPSKDVAPVAIPTPQAEASDAKPASAIEGAEEAAPPVEVEPSDVADATANQP